MKIVWLPEAATQLDLEYDYLVAKNPRAARVVFTRIVTVVKRLEAFPNSGRAGTVGGTRELTVPGLPYLVIYRVNADQAEILRVFHTARDWPALIS